MFTTVKNFFPAVVAILNANAALQTLFGTPRTTPLCIPWKSLEPNVDLPVITYAGVAGGGAWEGQDVIQIQLACWARTQIITDDAIAIACNALKLPAFSALGLSCCPHPVLRPALLWPDADPEQGDPAEARSDVTLSFLITG